MSLKPFLLTVIDVKDGIVLAKTPDGQAWSIPLETVYGKASAGKELRSVFLTMDADGLHESGLAHHMINELLNPGASMPPSEERA